MSNGQGEGAKSPVESHKRSYNHCGFASTAGPQGILVHEESVASLVKMARTHPLFEVSLNELVTAVCPHDIDLALRKNGETYGPKEWLKNSLVDGAWRELVRGVMRSLLSVGYCVIGYGKSGDILGEVVPCVIDPTQYALRVVLNETGACSYEMQPRGAFAYARGETTASTTFDQIDGTWIPLSSEPCPVLPAARKAVGSIAKMFGATDEEVESIGIFPKFGKILGAETFKAREARLRGEGASSGIASGGGDGGASSGSIPPSSSADTAGPPSGSGPASASGIGGGISGPQATHHHHHPAPSRGQSGAHQFIGGSADDATVPHASIDTNAGDANGNADAGNGGEQVAGDGSSSKRQTSAASRRPREQKARPVDAASSSLPSHVVSSADGTVNGGGGVSVPDIYGAAAADPQQPPVASSVSRDDSIRQESAHRSISVVTDDKCEKRGDVDVSTAATTTAAGASFGERMPAWYALRRSKPPANATRVISDEEASEAWPLSYDGKYDIIFDSPPIICGNIAMPDSRVRSAMVPMLYYLEALKHTNIILNDITNRPLIVQRTSAPLASTAAGSASGDVASYGFMPIGGSSRNMAAAAAASMSSSIPVPRTDDMADLSARINSDSIGYSVAGRPLDRISFLQMTNFADAVQRDAISASVASAMENVRMHAAREVDDDTGTVRITPPFGVFERMVVKLPENATAMQLTPAYPPDSLSTHINALVSVILSAFGVSPDVVLGSNNARVSTSELNMKRSRLTASRFQSVLSKLFERAYWRCEGATHLKLAWNAAVSEEPHTVSASRSASSRHGVVDEDDDDDVTGRKRPKTKGATAVMDDDDEDNGEKHSPAAVVASIAAETMGATSLCITFSPGPPSLGEAIELYERGLIRREALVAAVMRQHSGLSYDDIVGSGDVGTMGESAHGTTQRPRIPDARRRVNAYGGGAHGSFHTVAAPETADYMHDKGTVAEQGLVGMYNQCGTKSPRVLQESKRPRSSRDGYDAEYQDRTDMQV